MDEQQDESPRGGMGKITAWIGGVTALVVALGGLVTAVKEFRKEDAPVREAKAEVGAIDAKQAAMTSSDPAKSRPTSYTLSDGGTFKRIDGLWVWTNAEGVWRYSELDNDGTNTVAVARGRGSEGQDIYVRWPNAGGQGFQSYDEQENWTDGVFFTVVKS